MTHSFPERGVPGGGQLTQLLGSLYLYHSKEEGGTEFLKVFLFLSW